jgi:hypothetical protein
MHRIHIGLRSRRSATALVLFALLFAAAGWTLHAGPLLAQVANGGRASLAGMDMSGAKNMKA